MMHRSRTWAVANVETASELAEQLTTQTWCLCTGFRFGGYLFLNDSTSEDGIAEYGIVRESDGQQVESITFGWCDLDQAREYILQAAAGVLNYPCGVVQQDQIVPVAGHRCRLCA